MCQSKVLSWSIFVHVCVFTAQAPYNIQHEYAFKFSSHPLKRTVGRLGWMLNRSDSLLMPSVILYSIRRYTSLKDPNPLQQRAPDTSRPHRRCWSQPAPRTRQKHRRQPCKTRLATAKDWHPTLMNGTFEARGASPPLKVDHWDEEKWG